MDTDGLALRFLDGGGEMAEAIRRHDWSRSPLGPPSGWPATLKMAISTCLSSRFPMVVWWGRELLMLYNDAWLPILGATKHPSGLGRPGAESWPDTWPVVGVQFEQALNGKANWSQDQLLAANRRGFLEEAYFTYSHSPLRDASGDIAGVLTTVTETTARVLAERRERVQRDLSRFVTVALSQGLSVRQACVSMLNIIGLDNADVPFAILYLAGSEGQGLRLRASVGLNGASTTPDEWLPLAENDAWGAAAACRCGQPVELAADALGELPGGAWPEPCRRILALPLPNSHTPDLGRGALVFGLSARLPLDNAYREFLRGTTAQVGAAIEAVGAHRQERLRIEAGERLNAFDRDLMSARTTDALLDRVLDALIELHAADFGNVQLFDPRTRTLRIGAQRGFDAEFLEYFASVAADDGSACAQALQTGATIVIEDVELDAEFAPHRGIAAKADFRAVQSTPMLNAESREPVGMISVHFRSPKRTPAPLIALTEVYARVAGDVLVRRLAEQRLVESEAQLMIAKDDLERRVEERTRELAAANRQLVLQIEQRTKAEDAMRQMQRLEAVGQLTAGIAHDFNNLLMVVLGNVEFLARQLTDPGVLRRLDLVRHSAERGAKLTSHLLAFSRQQQLSPRPVDLRATVDAMRDLLRGTLGGSVRLRTSSARRPWPALADPTQIELVLLNLSINARDAMPTGGELTIEIRNVVVKRRSKKPGAPDPGEYVAICVRDTGAGMPPGVLARAFEPFFTTKPIGRGSGLGLAQVYGFAKQSRGGIAIDTKLGKGTVVRVFLPRASDSAEKASQVVADPAPDDRGRTVLLVDDDAAVRTTEAEVLASLGYHVLEAGSGGAALELLSDGRDIDALLIDFGMPGMNGAEVGRQALARRPGTPMLFVTGFADCGALADFPTASVLQKPFRREELAAALAEAISGRAVLPAR